MGILYDPKEELLVQLLVKGVPDKQAKVQAGFKPQASFKRILARPQVQKRLKEMMERSAARAELTRVDILEGVKADWHQARKLGQMSSALTAAKMLGQELHGMFVERREIGMAGDFSDKTEQELVALIRDGMAELGMEDAGEVIDLKSLDGIEFKPEDGGD